MTYREARISVIIPALPTRYKLLAEAITSVHAQADGIFPEILMCLDDGAEMPFDEVEIPLFASNQSAKVNAGVARASHDVVAILHDDDLWHPQFLKVALDVIAQVDFVTSTALETDQDGRVMGIIDCPVPSSWVFRKSVFDKVGPWSEAHHFHPDSEWLGRLGETAGVKRAHLMEAFAPEPRIRIGGEYRYNRLIQRPGMLAFLQQARPAPSLVRHHYPMPLVNHRQMGDGIMQRINEPERWAASQFEYQRLTERFGHIPW